MELESFFTGVFELLVVCGGALYFGVVLLSYYTSGTRVAPQIDRQHLVRSLGRLAVWSGVMALAMLVHVTNPIFSMLSEASAEVGNWLLSRRRETQ